jgi:hypothetical protein
MKPKRMEWISVKDMLPGTKPHQDWFKSENVLVLIKKDIVVTAHYEHGQFDGEEPWTNWWDHWCEECIEPVLVTHWMPLPEPPE